MFQLLIAHTPFNKSLQPTVLNITPCGQIRYVIYTDTILTTVPLSLRPSLLNMVANYRKIISKKDLTIYDHLKTMHANYSAKSRNLFKYDVQSMTLFQK